MLLASTGSLAIVKRHPDGPKAVKRARPPPSRFNVAGLAHFLGLHPVTAKHYLLRLGAKLVKRGRNLLLLDEGDAERLIRFVRQSQGEKILKGALREIELKTRAKRAGRGRSKRFQEVRDRYPVKV